MMAEEIIIGERIEEEFVEEEELGEEEEAVIHHQSGDTQPSVSQ